MTNKSPWKVGKEYILLNGLKARIYADNCGDNCRDNFPIHGAYFNGDGVWYPISWAETGNMGSYSLVQPEELKIKGEVWLLVRNGCASFCCNSESQAQKIMKTEPENNYAIMHVPYNIAPGNIKSCYTLK